MFALDRGGGAVVCVVPLKYNVVGPNDASLYWEINTDGWTQSDCLSGSNQLRDHSTDPVWCLDGEFS